MCLSFHLCHSLLTCNIRCINLGSYLCVLRHSVVSDSLPNHWARTVSRQPLEGVAHPRDGAGGRAPGPQDLQACVSLPCVLGVAASPSEPTSPKPSSAPLPVKGLARGSKLPCPPASWPPAPPTGPPDTHTHTHTHTVDRQADRHWGLSSSISLACPPPHTRAPSLPRRTGLQGVPSLHPCSPGAGGAGSALPSLPRGWGSHPPQSPLVHLLLLDLPLRSTG